MLDAPYSEKSSSIGLPHVPGEIRYHLGRDGLETRVPTCPHNRHCTGTERTRPSASRYCVEPHDPGSLCPPFFRRLSRSRTQRERPMARATPRTCPVRALCRQLSPTLLLEPLPASLFWSGGAHCTCVGRATASKTASWYVTERSCPPLRTQRWLCEHSRTPAPKRPVPHRSHLTLPRSLPSALLPSRVPPAPASPRLLSCTSTCDLCTTCPSSVQPSHRRYGDTCCASFDPQLRRSICLPCILLGPAIDGGHLAAGARPRSATLDAARPHLQR